MSRQLAGCKFGTKIDGPTRAALLECVAHRVAIEAWRETLPVAKRLQFNHPRTVLRNWKLSIKPPAPAASRPSPIAKAEPEVKRPDLSMSAQEKEKTRRPHPRA